MALDVEFGVAKTNKYASRESGDTAEIVERPGGGVSVVMVDGQGSGAAAKTLSLMLSSKAVSLLKDGVRDGAVARAVHDMLIAYRHGKVSAGFDILSFDFRTKTIVATRNSPIAMIKIQTGQVEAVESSSGPIGLYHFTRPMVIQLPAEPETTIVLVTDGIAGAGARSAAGRLELSQVLNDPAALEGSANEIADLVLAAAIDRDSGRPLDDMTVVAMKVSSHEEQLLIRRQSVRMPMP
jgi:serine phosphatase RsbU (regulator of sigma subunit)